MAKKRIKSKRGLFGVTYHYENGHYVGKSREGVIGGTEIHYDSEDRKIGSSRPGILADRVHSDKRNKRYVSSYPGLTGETHMSGGRRVGRTVSGMFGETYTSIEETDEAEEIFIDEELSESMENADAHEAENDSCDNNEGSPVVGTAGRRITRIGLGVLFSIETVLFAVLTCRAASRSENIVALIVACIGCVGIAVVCLYPRR